MKIVTLSDTHGKHDGIDVPDGDVLIHAGDFMNVGTDAWELFTFNKWFAAQPHRHKILVAGNHDRLFETNPEISRSWLHPSIMYLEDKACEIDGVRFWGAPWQPPFMSWAFNLDRPQIRKHWELIPHDTDFLITHAPPFGFLDLADGPEHLGCRDLAEIAATVAPAVHIFGHIHGSGGKSARRGATGLYNVSVLNEKYAIANAPTVIFL